VSGVIGGCIGFLAGGIIGVTIMAILVASKEDNDDF